MAWVKFLVVLVLLVLARADDITNENFGDRGSQFNRINVDWVVIGSGPAGATWANILSADLRTSVLVLESGTLEVNNTRITRGAFNRVLLNPDRDLTHHIGESRPEPGLNNRKQLYPQTGNLVGGSSAINNMNQVRPSPAMMQYWHTVTNSSVFTPENILRAAIELETFVGVTSHPNLRGTVGPLRSTQVPIGGPVAAANKFSDAILATTGYPSLQDYQLGGYGSTKTWQVFQFPNGLRSDSRTTWLGPDVVTQTSPDMVGVNGRKIRVMTSAEVVKILLETRGNNRDAVATGVNFVRAGELFSARARKGVILAAGFMSPHIAQVSGIGNREVLTKARIPVIVESPFVGFNITNHVATGFSFAKPSVDVVTDPSNANFTTTFGAFLPSPKPGVPTGVRGLQLIGQDGLVNQAAGLITPNPNVLLVTAFDLQTFSQGSVLTYSPSLKKNPIVQYNYLTDQRDKDFWFYVARQIIKPLAQYLSATYQYNLTNPSLAVIDDDVQLNNFIVNNVNQNHHGRGGMKMMPKSQGGVVDPETGIVYGTTNLYCTDTQALPILPDGNNQNSVFIQSYLLAKKAVSRS